MLRCIALITVRNGLPYLERCINHLLAQDIAVCMIDHMSSDGTYEHCQTYQQQGLIELYRMPYRNGFELQVQLEYKQQLMGHLDADWFIHQDIDEMLYSPHPEETLQSGILRADQAGANCINFNEFVFLPYADEIAGADYFSTPHYYFFEPQHPRLMRAWKNNSQLTNCTSGGHLLKGNLQLFAEDFVLRHYMFTSQEHAFNKYAERRFAEAEIERGWHFNRLNIPSERLLFPPKNKLNKLSPRTDLDKSRPHRQHYWEWQDD